MLGGVLLGAASVFLSFISLMFPGENIDLMGLLISFIIFAGGVVSVATCAARHKSNIALIILFAGAAALSFLRCDPYFWLIWPGVWSAVCAIIAIVFTCIPDRTPRARVVHGNRYIVAQYNPNAHYASHRIGAPPVAPPQNAPQGRPPQNGR